MTEIACFTAKLCQKKTNEEKVNDRGCGSVTANFRFTNVNGVCMHRFGTEKTICDFCHQGNSLNSQNLEP